MPASPKTAVQPPAPSPQGGSLQEWGMILLESLSFGALMVVLLVGVVLLFTGLYVQVIWPLTDWDLVNVSLERYQSVIELVLVTVFSFGFFAGYFFISGAAWKKVKPKAEASPEPAAPQRVIGRYRQ